MEAIAALDIIGSKLGMYDVCQMPIYVMFR